MDAGITQAPPLPEPPELNESPDDESADATPRSFNWGRFATYSASVLVVVIIGGLVAGAILGKKPLDQRTTQLVGTKITGVEIEWPSFRAKSKGHTDVKAPDTRPGATTTTIDNRNTEAGKAPAKPAASTKKKSGKYAQSAIEFPPDAPSKPEAPRVAIPDASANTWLPEQFQQELKRSAMKALGENPDPLSREPLDRVAQAMEDSGWFSGRPTVERQTSGLLKVRGTWRVPVGVIASGDREILIGADGAPMPVVYAKGQSGMPLIVGLQHPPTASADGTVNTKTKLTDEDAQASLELFLLLKRQPWASQVAAVDATGFATSHRLAILTTAGNRVEWGGRPSRPLVGEITTRGKLGRLEEFNARFGAIDAKQQRLEIYGPFMLVDYSQTPPDKKPDEPKDGAKPKPGDAKKPTKPADRKPTDG